MTLPSLFVIGDSISIAYGPHLNSMVKGIYDYDRKSGEEEALKNLDLPVGANGGDSDRVLEYVTHLESSEKFKKDILLINAGQHDIKTDNQDAPRQVSIEKYEENLLGIIKSAKAIAKTVIWVLTTPVNDEQHQRRGTFHRYNNDVLAYNEVANKVMGQASIPMIDLYTYTVNLGLDNLTDGVHFNVETAKNQAAYIAGFLQSV